MSHGTWILFSPRGLDTCHIFILVTREKFTNSDHKFTMSVVILKIWQGFRSRVQMFDASVGNTNYLLE